LTLAALCVDMKTILKSSDVTIPDDVTLTVTKRVVTVKGPRGSLVKDFRHLPVDMKLVDPKTLRIERWFTSGKQMASIRTACSHVENQITGVTKGFKYKMRFVYSHFPINVSVVNNGQKVEIRNFLGEKVIRVVDALEGVKVSRSTDVKDELVLEGNSIDNVSMTAASVQQICAVKRKDLRKFLDGIYVSHKGNVVTD